MNNFEQATSHHDDLSKKEIAPNDNENRKKIEEIREIFKDNLEHDSRIGDDGYAIQYTSKAINEIYQFAQESDSVESHEKYFEELTKIFEEYKKAREEYIDLDQQAASLHSDLYGVDNWRLNGASYEQEKESFGNYAKIVMETIEKKNIYKTLEAKMSNILEKLTLED